MIDMHHPADEFAHAIRNYFKIPDGVLRKFCKLCYEVSLEKIENIDIFARISLTFDEYLYPSINGSSVIDMTHPQRVQLLRFGVPIPANIRSVAELSTATDFRHSALLVSASKKSDLFIVGILTQQSAATSVIEQMPLNPVIVPPVLPGVMQIHILEPMRLSAWTTSLRYVGEINRSKVTTFGVSITESDNPIFEHINNRIDEFTMPLRGDTELYRGIFYDSFFKIISRTREIGKGGSFVLAGEYSRSSLWLKHKIRFTGIHDKLQVLMEENRIVAEFEQGSHIVRTSSSATHSAMSDYWKSRERVKILEEAIQSDVNIVAAMSKIDGALLLSWGLEVDAFGVEILESAKVVPVFLSHDSKGTELVEWDPVEFGMRHRSMTRLCSGNPDLVGVVVSQDGPVRFMKAVGSGQNTKVLIWENPILSVWQI